METIELVATNVEEATTRAAATLGVSPDQVKIEVVDETKGLFGKPGKVTVRASVKSTKAKAPKAEKAPKVTEPAPEPEAEPAKPKAKAARAPKKEAEAKPVEAPEAQESKGQDASSEDGEALATFLNNMFKAGELDAVAKCSELNGRYVNIEIDGTDVGYLVGRRGEVLNALQYLMNVVSARKLESGARVTLDGDNYRDQRASYLTDVATKLAEEVKSRGDEAVLDALPAFERRIIHQALVDFEGVTTYSEGEEPNRRIVIAPAG